MKAIKSILPAYSVAGGDTNFEAVPYEGNSLAVQIFYTGFNKADNKIRLQESIGEGSEYVDSKDANGNYIEITLATTLASDMIKVSGFKADFVRARFIEGTSGVGTISKINFLME